LWERKDDTYGSLRLAVVAEIDATDFLSSLVHEGVADFMSRFVTEFSEVRIAPVQHL
jgi:hypothetical protein